MVIVVEPQWRPHWQPIGTGHPCGSPVGIQIGIQLGVAPDSYWNPVGNWLKSSENPIGDLSDSYCSANGTRVKPH